MHAHNSGIVLDRNNGVGLGYPDRTDLVSDRVIVCIDARLSEVVRARNSVGSQARRVETEISQPTDFTYVPRIRLSQTHKVAVLKYIMFTVMLVAITSYLCDISWAA